MADSNALALVEIDGAIWVVIQPRTRHIWISVVGNHCYTNTVVTWSCVTGLNTVDKPESIFSVSYEHHFVIIVIISAVS